MTTHTLPVYTESAIQKACQWDGSSTHSLRRKKLNDLFERERKGACELRGKIKLESVWVLWAAVGGEEVTLALYSFLGVHQSSTPQDWAAGSIPIASHRDNSGWPAGQTEEADLEHDQKRSQNSCGCSKWRIYSLGMDVLILFVMVAGPTGLTDSVPEPDLGC